MEGNTSLLYQNEDCHTLYNCDSLFTDLHMDSIIAAVTEGLDEFNLQQYYLERPVRRSDAEFRVSVAENIREEDIRNKLEAFHIGLSKTRSFLTIADSVSEAPAKGKWKLDAASEYVRAVSALCGGWNKAAQSEGLNRFLTWLRIYVESDEFTNLKAKTESLEISANNIVYSLRLDINNNIVYFGDDSGCGDICAEFIQTFDRYNLNDIKRDITAFADIHMNVLEKKILSIVQTEHPDLLLSLSAFCAGNDRFIHEKIAAFERETMFYISYGKFVSALEDKGFAFTLPRFSGNNSLHISGGYDISLALVKDDVNLIVENDFDLTDGEHNFLLTGPNQGGKTTFSRMLGQVLLLSSLGLSVPCRDAEILWTNGLETHFNIEEKPGGDSGRLQDELLRLNRILSSTPQKSVVILNELFSSTTTYDAMEMGRRVLQMFEDKECVCLYVTHLFELAKIGDAVSLIAETSEDLTPTYKISRNPSGGNAYAGRLLAKHRLRKADIKERIHAALTALL